MLDQLKAEHPFLFLLVVTSAIVAIATLHMPLRFCFNGGIKGRRNDRKIASMV
jgi:hypothetical protein